MTLNAVTGSKCIHIQTNKNPPTIDAVTNESAVQMRCTAAARAIRSKERWKVDSKKIGRGWEIDISNGLRRRFDEIA